MKITGCYREKLTKEIWDKMTPKIRFNQLISLPYSDKKKKEWSEINWDKLGNRKNLVKGMLGVYMVSRYATSKFGSHSSASERRIKLCPDSVHYNILVEAEKGKCQWRKKLR